MPAGTESPREISADLLSELKKLQRLATLGLLTGSLAHEFNNLFTTILNSAALGLADEDPERKDRALARIQRAAERAAQLSRSILGFARGESEESGRGTCVPAEVIQDVANLLQKELQSRGVRLDLDVPRTPAVPVSAAELQHVLLNLMINACQAMPDGGILTVQVKNSREDRQIELVVADTGVGIPATRLKQIFEPFYTTKKGQETGGTGLGLAFCREIVVSAGGRIRVESKVGRGTRFVIRLPVARRTRRRVA